MDIGLWGPGSVTWKVTQEGVLLLGGPRALLLQLAHPKVAAGVQDHSNFQQQPIGRLYRTLSSTLTLVFGTTQQAEQAANGINRAHRVVKGVLPEDAGQFSKGEPYDAADPQLLLWVHATLIDTAIQVTGEFLTPLTESEKEDYWQESKVSARILGVTEEVLPSSYVDFRSYFDEMLSSEEICLAPFQRALGDVILDPKLVLLPDFVKLRAAALTSYLLPAHLAEAYGIAHTPERIRSARATISGVKRIRKVLPAHARLMPQARHAARRVSRGF